MHLIIAFLFLTAATYAPASASDWPRFRGPNGSGVAEVTNLPVEFGPQKNVIWKTPVPSGKSSPILTHRRLFLTAYENNKLLTLCLNSETGEILWRREIVRPRAGRATMYNEPASPTPATDGENVYAFFQDFGLISYSAEGKERWRLPLGPFRNNYGMAASPIVYSGTLILVCDQDIGSFMLAVNKDTGKLRWRSERAEVIGAGYSTPAIYQTSEGGAHVVVPGSFQMITYRLDTGEKVWWVTGLPRMPISGPVIGRDKDGTEIIYLNVQGADEGDTPLPPFQQLLLSFDQDKDGKLTQQETVKDTVLRASFLQVDMDGDGFLTAKEWGFLLEAVKIENALVAVRPVGRGDLTQTGVVWSYRKALPYIPSPLLYKDVLYLLKEGGIVTALNPATGAVYKQGRLQGALDQYFASPVAADGKVYTVSQNGQVAVIRAGRDWKVLAINDLDDECFATPALADGRLYIRTRNAVYCFSERRRAANG